MNTTPPILPGTYKDRSTGLILFGVLTIIVGLICAVMALFLGLTPFLASSSAAPKTSLQMMWPAMVLYIIAAVGAVWLGVGSIMKRRWARALLLVLSWSGLILGVISLVFFAVSFPELLKAMETSLAQAKAPASMVWVSLSIMGAIFFVLYLVLPGSWLLFYRGRSVKLTCEYYDQAERWTDRCPLPVLATVLWLAFMTAWCFVISFSPMNILPFFGTILSGLSGMVAFIILSFLCAVAAWRIYLLDVRTLWSVMAGIVLFSISALITYSRHDIMDIYRLMDFPPEQLAQMEKLNFLRGNLLYVSVVLWTVPALAYLFYIKRFFARTEAN